MEKVIIGIDLGGTNLRIGAVSKDNHLENFSKISSAVIADAEKPIEKICEIIEEYKEKNHLEQLEAISIGVPSSVENDKETIICTTNIRNRHGKVVFQNINIARELRDYFKVPVFVNNDVNNILLYDIAANHLENQKIVVGIYIGTGVGAAVSIDGQLLEGKTVQNWIWVIYLIMAEMRNAAAEKKDAVSAMLPDGNCKKFAENIIRRTRFRISL